MREQKTTKIPNDIQALIDCLDLMYNTVPQDVRDQFAPTMQNIRNELVSNHRLKLIARLSDKTRVLNEIANKNPPFLNGASDHHKGFLKIKAMARSACK